MVTVPHKMVKLERMPDYRGFTVHTVHTCMCISNLHVCMYRMKDLWKEAIIYTSWLVNVHRLTHTYMTSDKAGTHVISKYYKAATATKQFTITSYCSYAKHIAIQPMCMSTSMSRTLGNASGMYRRET